MSAVMDSVLLPVVLALITGYAIRDIVQTFRDHGEMMRKIDERLDTLNAEFDEEVSETTRGSLDFWGGFCPRCRSVHGRGECVQKPDGD